MVPDEYCGIPFKVWLDMFLDYALAIARDGEVKFAYEIIASALSANVFVHSKESLFLIHVCWFSKSSWSTGTQDQALMFVQHAL